MAGTMNDILSAYKERKFQKCLELINLFKECQTEAEHLLLENCKLVCESYIRIEENDPARLFEMQEQLYLFFEKVILVGINSNTIPLELRLGATYNFTFWLLYYSDVELGPLEGEYLELINKGLLSVLGKSVTSVISTDSAKNVLNNLMCLKNLLLCEEYKTALLIVELVIVITVYVVTLNKNLLKDGLKVVRCFVEESKHVLPGDFLQVDPTSLVLFKFGLCGSGTLLSDLNSCVIDYLHVLNSTFLFLIEEFKDSLKSLKKNVHSSVSSLWNYLVILNSYELENWDMCSRYLTRASSLVVHSSFKARFHIMQGKLSSVGRSHKEALRQFENALSLCANCPIIYYYLGQEYGKMGLTDSMVENFGKLVQVIQFGDPEEYFKPNFESILLDWIHPVDEITEPEAHYALAVSHGLNESFSDAAKSFEKVLECLEGETPEKKKRIVELPDHVTILHEASVMHLLLGNLIRAEQICVDAIDGYVVQKSPKVRNSKVTSLNKDVEWLEHVIHSELLDDDLEPKELSEEVLYTEDLLHFFPRNVVALLILSEIQRIQEVEEYKATLSGVFSIFSKHLAFIQKKEEVGESEQHALTLVKALTGKTCVKIANIQIKEENDADVEKMFKRALSCNKGDRDALSGYYKYLLSAGKNREALKLWNTFSKEKPAIAPDSLQSFALRYLLTDKVTNRELEKIQREMENLV